MGVIVTLLIVTLVPGLSYGKAGKYWTEFNYHSSKLATLPTRPL
jgi:hypothetical protein